MENRADLEFTTLLNALTGFIAARNQPAINNILRKSPMINWNNMLIDPSTGNNIFHIAAKKLPLVWVYGNSERIWGIETVKNKEGKTPYDILAEKYKKHYAKKSSQKPQKANPIKKTVRFKK
jgi:hypothetical protein